MKKLLMLGAILVLGVTAFAADQNIDADPNTNEAKVTVKARLVAENLVISDLEGNPIVLDFGKVSKTRKTGTSEAKTGYMVRYVGEKALDAAKDLTMELKGMNGNYVQTAVPVTLAEVSQTPILGPDGNITGYEAADTFDVTVGLNTYKGKMPQVAVSGHDYAEYTGTVFGTLQHSAELAKLDSGDYIGYTDLKVTIAE